MSNNKKFNKIFLCIPIIALLLITYLQPYNIFLGSRKKYQVQESIARSRIRPQIFIQSSEIDQYLSSFVDLKSFQQSLPIEGKWAHRKVEVLNIESEAKQSYLKNTSGDSLILLIDLTSDIPGCYVLVSNIQMMGSLTDSYWIAFGKAHGKDERLSMTWNTNDDALRELPSVINNWIKGEKK